MSSGSKRLTQCKQSLTRQRRQGLWQNMALAGAARIHGRTMVMFPFP
jgi:hypothetical protein